jgi:hypothetical protein
VWSLLCSIRQAGRKLRVGRVGPLLKLDARTVRKADYRLRDRDLLYGMTPVIPDQGLGLFRDRARVQYFLNAHHFAPDFPAALELLSRPLPTDSTFPPRRSRRSWAPTRSGGKAAPRSVRNL